jgi:hypothetical protein
MNNSGILTVFHQLKTCRFEGNTKTGGFITSLPHPGNLFIEEVVLIAN